MASLGADKKIVDESENWTATDLSPKCTKLHSISEIWVIDPGL